MLILAFDTTLSICSAVICHEGRIISREIQDGKKGHSEIIMPMIEKIMKKSQIDFSDIDLFATATGPGSYTGLRVCIALARGFKLALNKPVIGLNTLEIIAEGARRRSKKNYDVIVVNEAAYEEVYFQKFSDYLKPKTNPQRCSIEKLIKLMPNKKIILAGTASLKTYHLMESKSDIILDLSKVTGQPELPDALDLACLANKIALDSKDLNRNYAPNPVYMYEPYEK